MSASTPAAGAGTSTVTLSVSSSTSGSSTATASPGFLNHCPTVASVTDSPSAGTMISIAIDCHRHRESACSTSAFCSWLCLLASPVAVAADDARPT